MSFFSYFDKTAGGRRQAKYANMRARYKHMANRAKYNNKKAAFKANQNERVLGTSRATSDAYRKLVIGARERERKGKEQAYKAFAKARKVPTGEGSTRAQFSDYEKLLQTQSALENQVTAASGEQLQLTMQGIGRKDLALHRKNIGALGVPAQTPLMQPYQKENKFMTFMNFTRWVGGAVADYNNIQDSFTN